MSSTVGTFQGTKRAAEPHVGPTLETGEQAEASWAGSPCSLWPGWFRLGIQMVGHGRPLGLNSAPYFFSHLLRTSPGSWRSQSVFLSLCPEFTQLVQLAVKRQHSHLSTWLPSACVRGLWVICQGKRTGAPRQMPPKVYDYTTPAATTETQNVPTKTYRCH